MPLSLDRRAVLRFLGAGAASACPICLGLASASAADPKAAGAAHAAPHWSYEGEGAPKNWGKLSPAFRSCGFGLEQTPIDLAGGIKAELGPVDIDFKPMPLKVLNNGHTIQVNATPGSGMRLGEKGFSLLQFHFHHPSEHLLAGKAFAMECHFVHRSDAGDLAVLGVFMRPGMTNPALKPIWDAMPAKEGPEVVASATIDPAALLPRERGFYRYMGSLTTPPCSEGLTWTVFREPIELGDDQIRKFAALFPANARPVQQLSRRLLLESR